MKKYLNPNKIAFYLIVKNLYLIWIFMHLQNWKSRILYNLATNEAGDSF